MQTATHVLTLALVAGAVHAQTLALVAADSAMNESAAQQALQATGKFSSVTIFDTQTSTPDLADKAGNAETPKTLTVMIDKTAPTVAATVTPASGSTSVTVTFSGTDSGSGIQSCTAPVTLSPTGQHTAKGFCRDNAGNFSKPAIQTLNSSQPSGSSTKTGGDHDQDDNGGAH